jgi:SAM-dependent methyltransferase
MDLRNRVSREQVDRAKLLAVRGLLNYQPFHFADEFSVGAGLSIESGLMGDPPLVDIADPERYANDAFRDRYVVREGDRAAFQLANGRMRSLYDGLVDDLVAALGGVQGKTILDVGCNCGYFAVSLAQRGAARVVGLDQEPYGDTVALLNEICGTTVEFRQWSYDGSLQAPEQFDLVVSVAVLVHLSEPLRHLTWLGSAAREALWVFSPSPENAELSVQFHAVNRYYDHPWPYCFDAVTVSRPLLRFAFEQMGFVHTEVPPRLGTMSANWRGAHASLLGRRTSMA